MTRAKLMDAATIALVAFAGLMVALLARREFGNRRSAETAGQPYRVQADWTTYAAVGRILGAERAPVTIVAFSDFECPFCRRLAIVLDSLLTEQPGRFKVVFRHFPLPNHRFARPAARASECAAEQGRFSEMHNALFFNADSLGFASWWWYAKQASVPDSIAFHACLTRATIDDAVNRDIEAGNKLGVTGTPVMLINELRVRGMPSSDTLAAFIRRAEK